MHEWMLLVYKVPPQPTSVRVYVWRKLKRLGALLLHDAAWVLPDTPRNREHLQWLAAEIVELGGESLLWKAQLVLGQEEELVRRFVAQVESAYREILRDLERGDADLAALSRRYQQVRAQDYFRSELAERVRRALEAARREPLP